MKILEQFFLVFILIAIMLIFATLIVLTPISDPLPVEQSAGEVETSIDFQTSMKFEAIDGNGKPCMILVEGSNLCPRDSNPIINSVQVLPL